MTDKKEFDQKELRVAFERLNETAGLQPSAELDTMILQMAADEVESSAAEESNVTGINDISFRRGQREAHTSLKKKGIFPVWAMPLGLAATVLLSFGVVNRVLMSPEFDNLTKQSSYEAMSDEVVVTSDLNSKVSAEKDSIENVKRVHREELSDGVVISSNVNSEMRAENTNATITVNGNQMDSDISFVDRPRTIATEIPEQNKPQGIHKGNNNPSAAPVISNGSRILNREETVAYIKQKEEHASLAKEKRERLTQARRSAPVESEIQMAPTAGFSVSEPAPTVSSAGASDGSVMSADAELAGASRVDTSNSELQAEAVSSVAEMDSLEEVVVTGSRMKNDSDDLADKAFETKRQVLKSVLFEHKQCQVKQDCALIALACDSCDCLESVNNEHYTQYQSEFNQAEIDEQCINTTVECVRNYCQVQQAE